MKIVELLKQEQRARLSPLKARTLDFLERHPDEVFTYHDPDLVASVRAKPSAVGFTLWWLERNGLIGKEKVAGRVYFGSRKAIDTLRRQNGYQGRGKRPDSPDPLAQARVVRERIQQRAGTINSLSLLEASRRREG